MQLIQPVYTKEVVDENSRELHLEYCVTESVCLSDGTQGIPTYGIRVQLSFGEDKAEVSLVQDVTPSKKTALELLRILYENSVTPVALRDVIEDFVSLQV